MIPKGKEWKAWTPIERTTYVAQLLVPLSLLITVVFSYLTWQESRLSLETQIQLFEAQSNPELTIERPTFVQLENSPVMIVPIENAGLSVANRVCLKLYLVGEQSPFLTSCDRRPFTDLSIQPAQEFDFPLVSAHVLEPHIGFLAETVHVLRVGGGHPSCDSEKAFQWLLLHVTFSNSFESEYGRLFTLLVCAP